jgi:hypothetical protein
MSESSSALPTGSRIEVFRCPCRARRPPIELRRGRIKFPAAASSPLAAKSSLVFSLVELLCGPTPRRAPRPRSRPPCAAPTRTGAPGSGLRAPCAGAGCPLQAATPHRLNFPAVLPWAAAALGGATAARVMPCPCPCPLCCWPVGCCCGRASRERRGEWSGASGETETTDQWRIRATSGQC